jgi:SAM-dependent methyltransferase
MSKRSQQRRGSEHQAGVNKETSGRRFIKHAGLSRIPPSPELWRDLERRLPAEYVDRLSKVMTARERGERTVDPYPLIWESPETAKATYGWFAAVSEAWLAWIDQFGSFGPRVLDLGCGIGLHACYYAVSNPQSQIVGVDITREGVARAVELAAELGVENVRFVCGDFRVLRPEDLGGPCDTVTASTFLVDVQAGLLLAPDDDPWSTSRSVRLAVERTHTKLLARAATFVADGGTYYGLERAPSAVAFARLLGGLVHAGFTVDQSSASMLQVNHRERLPAFRATKVDGVRAADLEDATRIVHQLYPEDLALDEQLQRDPPVERLWGREIHVQDDGGAGITRLDVFRLRSGAMIYSISTSRGYRHLIHVATAVGGIARGRTSSKKPNLIQG